MIEAGPIASDRAIRVARCHEIQVNLGTKEVPEFEEIPEIGMAVRLALHIRGLPALDYQTLRLVASHFLGIPTLAIERIIRLLGEVEFVRIDQEGSTIKLIVPTVPFYDDIYERLGEFAETERDFNEAEQLALALVTRLARAPENVDRLRETTGAEGKLFTRAIQIGTAGNYLITRRARGRDILLNPTYFAENPQIFADAVAASGTSSVGTLLRAIKGFQGYPLQLVQRTSSLGGVGIDAAQLKLLNRLAEDGIVKPPSITTPHAGEHHFLFTPTPGGAALSPTKREIYERAMAIVAAMRQGQLLPKQYAIRSPAAVIGRLRADLRLGRATTEATHQYKQLVHLRIGRLVPTGGRFAEFHVIDTPENRQALNIAYGLVTSGEAEGVEVDDDARTALQRDQDYVESLIASSGLRTRGNVVLGAEQQLELDMLLLGGPG